MGEFMPSPLLFEQMRSFVELAQTLNLSEAVKNLQSTRQTVRRHISYLEEVRGERLFSLKDRRYALTSAGKRALREAQEVLARSRAWVQDASGHRRGLFYLTAPHDEGFTYFLQQHPLNLMWNSKSDLLPFGLQSWADARGQIEDPGFQAVRPWMMIFRRHADDWLCVEVGEKSSFATWYGWERTRSSVGHGIASLPGGSGFADLLSQPFHETRTNEGVRLDHIHTRISMPGHDDPVPITYERLLLGCYFPDGSGAIAALINRTYDVKIDGLPQGMARSMPVDQLMTFQMPEHAQNRDRAPEKGA